MLVLAIAMRNNLYMENYLTNSVMLANLSDYVWGTNAGEGKFTPVPKDDSADCATALLLGKGEVNTNDIEKLLGRKPKEVSELLDKFAYMWEENVTNWKQIK